MRLWEQQAMKDFAKGDYRGIGNLRTSASAVRFKGPGGELTGVIVLRLCDMGLVRLHRVGYPHSPRAQMWRATITDEGKEAVAQLDWPHSRYPEDRPLKGQTGGPCDK